MLKRKILAELLGTAFLLTAVVGSGIMAQRLADGNVALALLANALATGAALLTLINTLGPVSGAHFNPLVSLALMLRGELGRRDAMLYIAAQFAGAVLGVFMAHALFDVPVLQVSTQVREGFHLIGAEAVASFGLLSVILLGSRHSPDTLPASVAAYITAAYWFTASTSFANPAVTLARGLTDTFGGIRPLDVPGFWLGQLAGAAAAWLLLEWRPRTAASE